MNAFSFSAIFASVAVGTLLVACNPSESPPASGSVPAQPAGPEKSATSEKSDDRTPITPVVVEIRADGMGYLPGAAEPFTGEAITPFPDQPWLAKEKEPWREGKRHGDKIVLFKNGTAKTLRRYESGIPKYAAAWHKNGRMKFELGLNAHDKGEGPYQRWYEDGTVESTAGFDAEERWHGELKEWTRSGELKTHHLFKHGILVNIIFESPESKVAREATGLTLTPEPAGQ
ncbi:MAG: hypothetical protein JWL81_2072 [Verrucomicrobiales bacterium]|nr:hypothetical protein [Verrucomicrobiales bacterium]